MVRSFVFMELRKISLQSIIGMNWEIAVSPCCKGRSYARMFGGNFGSFGVGTRAFPEHLQQKIGGWSHGHFSVSNSTQGRKERKDESLWSFIHAQQ